MSYSAVYFIQLYSSCGWKTSRLYTLKIKWVSITWQWWCIEYCIRTVSLMVPFATTKKCSLIQKPPLFPAVVSQARYYNRWLRIYVQHVNTPTRPFLIFNSQLSYTKAIMYVSADFLVKILLHHIEPRICKYFELPFIIPLTGGGTRMIPIVS